MKNKVMIKFKKNEFDKMCNLNDCHKYLKTLFSDFQKFCDTYKINCFLMWGTLLGCKRSGGIIPWDDDIDVAIVDDEYEKLLSSLPFLSNFGLSYYHFSTTNSICANVFRIYKKGFYEVVQDVNSKFLTPVCIDIFVAKKLSDSIDGKVIKKYDQKMRRIYLLLSIKEARRPSGNCFKGFVRIVVRLFLKLLFPGKTLNLKIEKYSKILNKRNGDYSYFFPDTLYHEHIKKYDKKLLELLEDDCFEGTKTKVPKKYDLLLTKIYNNWRKPVDRSNGGIYKKIFIERDFVK